jgi:hypothetical protein
MNTRGKGWRELILLLALSAGLILFLHHTQRMDNARKLIEFSRGISQ